MVIKHHFVFKRCGSCGDVENNKKKSEQFDDGNWECPPFIAGPKTTFTMMLLLLITLLGVSVSVLGDDTQAFRDTLSSLCSLNKEGNFGACCRSYDISSVTLASSPARNCFIDGLGSTSGSVITSLFVL